MIDLFVVNFNTRAKLQRLLDTLKSDDNYMWNLYIADNGSTDGSVQWLKEFQHDYRIAEIMYNDNIGYSAACNRLALMGKGDIYGFLNADVWMTSEQVAQIQASFDRHKDQSIMGPKQRDENGRITHAGIIGSNVNPKHRGWHQLDIRDRLYRDRARCVTVSGSAYFIRSMAWELLKTCAIYKTLHPEAEGAFLPTPHYYEETWCSYHARAHGLGVYYDGRISIGHSWHASSEKGGHADKFMPISQKIFRHACDEHGIARN